MTLKEKFGKLFLKGHNTKDFEQIAEDFAIGFLDSIRDYELESGYRICFDEKSSKELLEIYKKEKGL
jgi:hypothetical protein